MTSWLDLDATDPFGLQTLPYARLLDARTGPTPRVGVRVGGFVLDAAAAAEQAGMESGETWALLEPQPVPRPRAPGLGGRPRVADRGADRRRLPRRGRAAPASRSTTVHLHLPFEVADYVDFYAAEHHARERRPDLPARQSRPARRAGSTCPSAYHGRAGTVVASGTDVVRPSGQHRAAGRVAAVVRAERAPRHRGRGRFRRRRGDGPRYARAALRGRRPPLRGGPAQRLERPRHPGVGVRAARPVPRQVVRDEHLRVGDADGRARRRPGRPARAGARAVAVPARAPTRAGSTSTSR